MAEDILKRIAALYEIEREIRGQPPEARLARRQEASAPIVEDLRKVLDAQSTKVSGKSPIGSAIRYTLSHWDGLVRFLDDGRIELDTNTVERSIRPPKTGAKNFLFAGSDGGGVNWPLIGSLIQTAKMNGVEPFAWFKDCLQRIVSGRTAAKNIASLLPWNWQPPDRTS